MTDDPISQAREALEGSGRDPDAYFSHLATRRALRTLIEHAEQVERERDDLESRLADLLCELTDGRMSKTGYDVRTMVREVEEAFDRAAQTDADDAWSEVVKARAERDEWKRRAEARLVDDVRRAVTMALAFVPWPVTGVEYDASQMIDALVRELSEPRPRITDDGGES